MLLQSPLQEPIPSPENFTTPDQVGKINASHVEEEDDGDIRKKRLLEVSN